MSVCDPAPTYAPCPNCGCPEYYGPQAIVYQGERVVWVECRGCQIRRLPVHPCAVIEPSKDVGHFRSLAYNGGRQANGGGEN